MIPEEKSASVARALREAFGVSEFEEIRRITKGLSSDLVFRIVVHGAPFLLRVATRIDERNDPKRQFACMKTAAEAGIAPRVLYVNAEDGISITDFVQEIPFPDAGPGGTSRHAAKAPRTTAFSKGVQLRHGAQRFSLEIP